MAPHKGPSHSLVAEQIPDTLSVKLIIDALDWKGPDCVQISSILEFGCSLTSVHELTPAEPEQEQSRKREYKTQSLLASTWKNRPCEAVKKV